MAHPAETDLLWNGKKIGGCAFRKTRKGVLQQACLFLQVPDWSYIVSCLKNEEDLYAMQASSISIEELAGPSDKPSIQESIIQKFKGIPP